jgi:hypothetical protein
MLCRKIDAIVNIRKACIFIFNATSVNVSFIGKNKRCRNL